MRKALPQRLACSNIIVIFMCHASKLKSLWIWKSSNITVCSKASTGGALVLFPVMVELSKYDKILWAMSGWLMQAIIATLCFWHFSHSVISMLNTRFSLWARVIGLAPQLGQKPLLLQLKATNFSLHTTRKSRALVVHNARIHQTHAQHICVNTYLGQLSWL